MKPTFQLRTFSLRSLIVGVTLCGIGLAIYVSPWAEHRRQLRRVETVKHLAGLDYNRWQITGENGEVLLVSGGGTMSPELVEAIVDAKLITKVVVWRAFPAEDYDRLSSLWMQTFRYNGSPPLTYDRRNPAQASPVVHRTRPERSMKPAKQ